MFYKAFLTLILLAISAPVQSAPYKLTTRQANDVAKQNGLAAQKQNVEFASKKSTDACQNGEIACVESAFAQCVNSKWVLTKCATGACFAVPETNKPGTSLVCEQKAAAATRFAGVTGGVDGKGSNAPASASPVAPSPSAPVASATPSTTPKKDDPECDGEEEDGEEEDDCELEEGEEDDCDEEDPEEEECEDGDDPAPLSAAVKPTASSTPPASHIQVIETITKIVTKTVAASSTPSVKVIPLRKRQTDPLDPLQPLAVDPSGGIPPMVPSLVPLSPTVQPSLAASTVVPLKPLSSPNPLGALGSALPAIPSVPSVAPSPSAPVVPSSNPSAIPPPLAPSAVPPPAPTALPPALPSSPSEDEPITVTVLQVLTVTVTQGAQVTPSAVVPPVVSGSAIPSAIPSVVISPQAPSIPPGAGRLEPSAPSVVPFHIISASATPSASVAPTKGLSDLNQPASTNGVRVANPNADTVPTPAPSPFPTLDKAAFESLLTAAVTA